MNSSDELEFSAVDVSKAPQMTSKTGDEPFLRDESGGYRLTAQVVSGIQAARARSRLSYGTCEGANDTAEPHPKTWGCGEAIGRIPSGRIREGLSTVAGAPADSPVVAGNRLRIAVGRGAKGRGCPGARVWSTEREGIT